MYETVVKRGFYPTQYKMYTLRRGEKKDCGFTERLFSRKRRVCVSVHLYDRSIAWQKNIQRQNRGVPCSRNAG